MGLRVRKREGQVKEERRYQCLGQNTAGSAGNSQVKESQELGWWHFNS